jgi:hypothetical protein
MTNEDTASSAPLPLADVDDERRRPGRSKRASALVMVALLGVVALTVSIVAHASSNGRRTTTSTTIAPPKLPPHVPAKVDDAVKVVAAAVGTTNAAGSYTVHFDNTETAGSAPPKCDVVQQSDTRLDNVAPLSSPSGGSTVSTDGYACVQPPDVTTTGVATINVDPYAMKVVSHVSNFGDVTLFIDANDVWEYPGGTYGSNGMPTVSGSPLSQFASLVESTLGQREGALAMQNLASPTGYIALTENAIADATPIGTGTVDGVAVTNYRVTLDPNAKPEANLTTDQAETISAAQAILHQEGFSDTTQIVSVDAAGYIRHTHNVATFADGATVTTDDSFSDFGCAGVVPIPRRPAPASPPATCLGPTTGTPETSPSTATPATPGTTAAAPPAPAAPTVPTTTPPPTAAVPTPSTVSSTTTPTSSAPTSTTTPPSSSAPTSTTG